MVARKGSEHSEEHCNIIFRILDIPGLIQRAGVGAGYRRWRDSMVISNKDVPIEFFFFFWVVCFVSIPHVSGSHVWTPPERWCPTIWPRHPTGPAVWVMFQEPSMIPTAVRRPAPAPHPPPQRPSLPACQNVASARPAGSSHLSPVRIQDRGSSEVWSISRQSRSNILFEIIPMAS